VRRAPAEDGADKDASESGVSTDAARARGADHSRMHDAFPLLARRRAAGVGLALVVECAALAALAFASPAAVVGVPAAIAAAIAGTVAVVYGPLDGALVALAGAAVFLVAGGWRPGEFVALAVWPAVVAAAGAFARRVSRHRAALHEAIAAQELERRRLADGLHDETAQTLATALLALRRAEQAATPSDAAAAHEMARDLVRDAVEDLRSVAVDLRPRALDDFGLAPALARLGTTFAERTGVAVDVRADAEGERLPPALELALYRVVQEALANVTAHADARTVRVVVDRQGDAAVLDIRDDGRGFDPSRNGHGGGLSRLRERISLLGGRLAVVSSAGAGTSVRAEIPLRSR
jgi:signal transduction histidine kinase